MYDAIPTTFGLGGEGRNDVSSETEWNSKTGILETVTRRLLMEFPYDRRTKQDTGMFAVKRCGIKVENII